MGRVEVGGGWGMRVEEDEIEVGAVGGDKFSDISGSIGGKQLLLL